MNPITLLSISNIRKKKLQNSLIVLLILLSTLLIATAITIIFKTGDVFLKLHKETQGSHQIVMLSKEFQESQKSYQWWETRTDVKTTPLFTYKSISGIYHEDKEIVNFFPYIMSTPEEVPDVDKLITTEGNTDLVPHTGSVRIPTSLAYAYGIKVGELLQFGQGLSKITVEVSAIVIDLPYCAPFSNGARIWMNSNDYEKYVQQLPGEDQYMFGLRFNDYDQSSQHWKEFENYLGAPFLESIENFEEISSFYLIMNHVIGAIMIFVGTIMILISLFTIKYTISDAILSDYKSIGIIKSLGLTSTKLMKVYILQFFLLAIVGIIIGTVLSTFISNSIIESSLSYIRINNLTPEINDLWIYCLVGFSLLIIIILFTYLQVKKIKDIHPAQAIRFGMSDTQNIKFAKWLTGRYFSLQRYPLTYVIGIKNLIKNKKSSFLIALLTMMTSAITVFGFLLLHSISNIQKNSPLWGYDSSHIAVITLNQSDSYVDDFEAAMASDERIKNISRYSGTTGVFPMNENNLENDGISLNINIDVLDGDYDEVGYAVIKGRNPENQNEITLGVNVAKKLNKEIGDICNIYIRGVKYELTLVGIYQSIANMSFSGRIIADVIKSDSTPLSQIESYFINLKDATKAEEFVRFLNDKYMDGLTAVTQKALIDGVFNEVSHILIYPMLIIGLLFTSVTFIIIYSTCRINVQKDSKCYGIYKSIGMLTYKIRLAVTAGVTCITVIGAVCGVLIGNFVIPNLMGNILVKYGIVKLPILFNWGGVLIIVLLTIIVASLGSWLSTHSIRKTSPRILVIE